MTNNRTGFPIPVVALVGPGSQADDAPAYLPMPQGMVTWQAAALPEPGELAARAGCAAVLRQALAALRAPDAITRCQAIDLGALPQADLELLNQVLGEGEVAAQAGGDQGLRVQESVYAGVWRVLQLRGGMVVGDRLEVGAMPQCLMDAAALDADEWGGGPLPAPPADLMNAPSLLAELAERSRRWRPGTAAFGVNLSLLPLSAGDSAHLQQCLGEGRVAILSRGYGNCRITNTRLAHTWRVTYFNSTEVIILDSLEVCAVPEVACAAAEDLADSADRLAELLQWVQAS